MMTDLNMIKWNEQGLVPAVIQDAHNKKVLMLGYMNEESLGKTLKTGKTWFYSRSRQKLWNKGETSGHFQYVKSVSYDCDGDTLLIQVEQVGVACHTGANSCFFRELPCTVQKQQSSVSDPNRSAEEAIALQNTDTNGAAEGTNELILAELFAVIQQRRRELPEGSYTTYLFNKGTDKILKKIGEEATEIIIAAKGGDNAEVIYETGDLLYHLLVLLAQKDIQLQDVWAELAKRH